MDPLNDDARSVVSRYLAAWHAGDLTAVLASYHPELVLEWPGSHTLAGRHAGLDHALGALAELQSRTGRVVTSIGPVERSDDGRIAVEVIERWSCPEPVEVSRLLTFDVADGRIVSCTVVEADQPLIDRLIG